VFDAVVDAGFDDAGDAGSERFVDGMRPYTKVAQVATDGSARYDRDEGHPRATGPRRRKEAWRNVIR
jgi:hypothetical protein